MTRVEQLEQEIAKLSADEFAQLRDWLLEQDWNEWDREIKRDVKAAKLDRLMKQALLITARAKRAHCEPPYRAVLPGSFRRTSSRSSETRASFFTRIRVALPSTSRTSLVTGRSESVCITERPAQT